VQAQSGADLRQADQFPARPGLIRDVQASFLIRAWVRVGGGRSRPSPPAWRQYSRFDFGSNKPVHPFQKSLIMHPPYYKGAKSGPIVRAAWKAQHFHDASISLQYRVKLLGLLWGAAVIILGYDQQGWHSAVVSIGNR